MRHIPSLTLCLLLTVLAAQAQRETFDTPEEAAHALIAAAADNNSIELNAIFGPKGVAILTSGDAAQDKAERQEFVFIARQKYQIEADSMSRDRVILSIGDDDWPFPVPIVRANGKWSFDTTMGSTMLQARRIGADELDAIEICTGYAAAEMEYAQQHGGRQYAQRILSSPGKDDGLYSGGHGLVPKEFADSAADGVSALKPKRYHGYFFKVLTGQGPDAPGGQHDYLVKDALLGGFALVAWPADYGVTGIHTFIVNQDGVVYESNLGHPANALAAPVDRFNPDANWRAVN
jgi:DUF2950 family protein